VHWVGVTVVLSTGLGGYRAYKREKRPFDTSGTEWYIEHLVLWVMALLSDLLSNNFG
jgi:hypothetical protein